ncbi:MAG TPA: TetR/AcrR family transcriptional regulator [Spirochaetota bacterium]|nr:TetR/AcrR family transcriptional regulator [Spirochaetota bacterium]HRZ26363.1 TetR/AcrR family transcriptional regulator [Spirochaetota bacterium]HSA13333.1 TetR/AcrR family transcriptional regulator [Spirochaetota bacterium]
MSTQKPTIDKNNEFRLKLYAEVGKYFSPKGEFNEKAFRESLHQSLIKIRESSPRKNEISDIISNWLTSYLSDVIKYLHEKKMPDASLNLLTAAIDVSSNLGIKNVVISAEHLRGLLAFASSGAMPVHSEEKANLLDEKRKKIFDAAIEVFGQKGYHKATIDEIAALSKVGKGSVYRYFKSKEDLLEQLLKEKYHEIIERVSHILSEERDILVQIQEMIEFWIGFIESNPVLYKLIQTEEINIKGKERVPFYDYIVDNLPMFKERILSLNKEKKVKTTNFYTVFYGIMGFMDGVAHKWFRRGMNYPLRDEIPIILEVLFNGFVGESKSNRSFISLLKKTMESITNIDH